MQKLIIAIVSNEDSTAASRALTKGGFSVTRLATTGGFLLSGNTTMLVGTDADRVDEAIHIIGENSCKRNKWFPAILPLMPVCTPMSRCRSPWAARLSSSLM